VGLISIKFSLYSTSLINLFYKLSNKKTPNFL